MTRLESVAPKRVADLLDEISQVWIGITDERLRVIVPRHTERAGFRFLAARADDGRLAGFAYGYIGGPGQWWHDTVARAMTREQRERWLLPGHFELVELHVRPELQRRGIGGRLLDTILEALESPTALLSTQVDNTRALALYRGRGWRIVHEEIRFTPDGRAYHVLGREIP